MSKTTMAVFVPATAREEVTVLRCDLCGAERRRTMAGYALSAWPGKGRYDADEVECKGHFGSSYPEGGSGTDEEFDVCPDCWKTKVVPWFKSQGAQPRITDWEF